MRWVLAVPESYPIQNVQDLEGKVVATELVATAKRYLAENGVSARVGFSWGATEAKLPELVDAIVEAISAMLPHSAGLAVCRDEILGWVRSFDSYKDGPGGSNPALSAPL